MIFTEYERTDDGPKKMSESDFAFLDRSPRPEIAAVRSFVVQLLEAYPHDGVAEMVARVRSGDDVAFRSAGFELLIYDFLTRLGFKLQPHPVLKNGSERKPDFHVIAPDGSEFYLEASLATEDKGENWSANAMINTALDYLDSTHHPDFFVKIISEGEPTTQPSGKKLQRAVMNWLKSLDYDEVSKNGGELAFINWHHENWHLLVQAMPVKNRNQKPTKRLIGVSSMHSGLVDSSTPIRDKLKEKGQRYGELDLPLLVAVNFSAFNLNPIDEMQALYGQEQFVVNVNDRHAEPELRRAQNGLWFGTSGPRAVRVSGAWLFNDLTFYTAARRKQTVYFNPWAKDPLPDILKQLPHATMTEDFKIQRNSGASLRDIFRLDERWPE